MEKINIIEKLNNNNNFHLSLKTIQVTDKNLLLKLKEKLANKSIVIDNLKDCYDLLLLAYNKKIEYVLINEIVDFTIPILTIISNDNTNIIKYKIPVYCLLKDNKIIQKVKSACHKFSTSYTLFKNQDELILEVLNFVNK